MKECQHSELSIGWRITQNKPTTLGFSNRNPSCGTHPNVAVFRCERTVCMQIIGAALPVEILCPEIDSLSAKQKLGGAPAPECLEEDQITFDT